jgi:hypothetical protein
MREVFYCEFTTHYMMGDKAEMVRFTPTQLKKLIGAALEEEALGGAEGPLYDMVEEIEKENKVSLYYLLNAEEGPLFGKKGWDKRILKALEKGKPLSAMTEEGSWALATTKHKAQQAIDKIESKIAKQERW